jgi:hypothetical protein
MRDVILAVSTMIEPYRRRANRLGTIACLPSPTAQVRQGSSGVAALRAKRCVEGEGYAA